MTDQLASCAREKSLGRSDAGNVQYGTAPLEQPSARPGSPIRLSVYPSGLREAALTVIEENALSPGKIAILPTDIKVELPYELSLISDAPLTARFKVEHWLLNPCAAEVVGNDWDVSDDCDLLTSQVIDAWSNLPNNITVSYSSMSDCISQRDAQRLRT